MQNKSLLVGFVVRIFDSCQNSSIVEKYDENLKNQQGLVQKPMAGPPGGGRKKLEIF